MLKVEVTGNNQIKKSAKGVEYVIQEAYVTLPNQKYPARIELFAPRDQSPYAVGDYTLAPESFAVGEYGRLECRPVLTPIKPSK